MPFTMDDLADQVLALLHTSARVTRADRGADEDQVWFTLDGFDDARFTIHLANLFTDTSALSIEERGRHLAAFVATAVDQQADPTWDEAQPRLRAVLRPITFTGGLGVGARPFVPYIDELVVIDSPTKVTYVQDHHVARWGVSRDEVHAAARANIPESTPLVPEEDDDAGLWKLDCDSGHETSHVLAEGGLASLAEHLGGRPVAIMPSPRGVWVGSGDDDVQLRALLDAARGVYDAQPRNISPALYTVDDDGVVIPLELPADHPLAAEVHAGHLELAAKEYANQKAQLDEAGVPGVARARLLVVDELARYTMCEWPRFEDALLPVTDLVAIFDARGVSSVLVPWDVVRDLAGAWWQPWDGRPARVRTHGYPDAATIVALFAQAIELR